MLRGWRKKEITRITKGYLKWFLRQQAFVFMTPPRRRINIMSRCSNMYLMFHYPVIFERTDYVTRLSFLRLLGIRCLTWIEPKTHY